MHQAGAQLSCRRGSLSGGAGEIFGDRGSLGLFEISVSLFLQKIVISRFVARYATRS